MAVVLNAQCTDQKGNEITQSLFTKACTQQQMMKLNVKLIEDIIRPQRLESAKATSTPDLRRGIRTTIPQTSAQ